MGTLGIAGDLDDLKEQFELAKQDAAESKKALEEAEDDAARFRREAQELLEKELERQRSTFDEEFAAQEARYANSHAVEKALKEEIKGLQRESSAQTKTHLKEAAQIQEQMSKMQKEIDRLKAELEKKKPKPVEKKPSPQADTKKFGSSPLGNIDLDEGPDALPISQQIGNALRKNSTRVMDLFRSWDADGDGEVTRAEFHKAMKALGLEVPKKDVDLLFDEWDKGGDGAIGFKELQKILSSTRPTSPKTQVQEAGKSVKSALKMVSALKKPAAVKTPS